MNASIEKLIVATAAPLTGFAISHTTVNMWLQTGSLAIGIIVGLLTIISILKKKKE